MWCAPSLDYVPKQIDHICMLAYVFDTSKLLVFASYRSAGLDPVKLGVAVQKDSHIRQKIDKLESQDLFLTVLVSTT